MTTILATYYAKIQDVPDSEYIPLSSIIIRTEYRYLRLPIPLIPL